MPPQRRGIKTKTQMPVISAFPVPSFSAKGDFAHCCSSEQTVFLARYDFLLVLFNRVRVDSLSRYTPLMSVAR